MKKQIVIESTQYINLTDFCTRYKVSPKKLPDLVSEGLLGGIVISGVMYYDVSKPRVIRKALSYKSANRSYYSGGGEGKVVNPKYANDFDRNLELSWRESMGM